MKTENYREAEKLVAMGLAVRTRIDCIDFKVDHGKGWIHSDEFTATIDCGNVYDCGDIDSEAMKVIGCKNNYDIIKEVR